MPLIKITPQPAPRINYKATWTKPAQRYFAYCNRLRYLYRQELPASLRLVFYMPMPPSWSNKKRLAMNTKSHRQKPDLDNLIKSTLDALDKDNDSYVWQIYAEKYWAKEGAIEIEELQ